MTRTLLTVSDTVVGVVVGRLSEHEILPAMAQRGAFGKLRYQRGRHAHRREKRLGAASVLGQVRAGTRRETLQSAQELAGLDADARARLGQRFYRAGAAVGDSTTADTTGSGLGWSIVRRIAERERLLVDVDTSPALGGLRVRVTPRQNS